MTTGGKRLTSFSSPTVVLVCDDAYRCLLTCRCLVKHQDEQLPFLVRWQLVPFVRRPKVTLLRIGKELEIPNLERRPSSGYGIASESEREQRTYLSDLQKKSLYHGCDCRMCA
jgi:hypothetical protein